MLQTLTTYAHTITLHYFFILSCRHPARVASVSSYRSRGAPPSHLCHWQCSVAQGSRSIMATRPSILAMRPARIQSAIARSVRSDLPERILGGGGRDLPMDQASVSVHLPMDQASVSVHLSLHLSAPVQTPTIPPYFTAQSPAA